MNPGERNWCRRDWVRTAAGLICFGRGVTSSALIWASADLFEQIQTRAREARMQPFETTEGVHFRAIGDASARHRQDALDLCEAFAPDYFAHFRAKGFTLDWPAEKLPVVVLASPTSYAAFERDFVDESVGGSFDLEHNWLVTFDFRSLGNRPRNPGAADPRLDNTMSLVHEVFHQLSYNTGMLDRKTDLPLCLTEGLAEYAETWRPTRKNDVIGAVNKRRRLGLELSLKSGVPLISIRDLLTNDLLQNDARTAQGARSQSWLLVYKLLKDPAQLPRFRAYLKAVHEANDPARRVELATTHLGDLEKLGREILR